MRTRTPGVRARFLALWAAGVLSIPLVLPYALGLPRSLLDILPVSLWAIAMTSLLHSALLLAVFVGLCDSVGPSTTLTVAIAARDGVREALGSVRSVSAAAIAIAGREESIDRHGGTVAAA